LSEPEPEPAAAAPPADPNYYVVTDYTGDQSLEDARTAVGDAYVRNFSEGARIQMGAFDEEGSAQELVQQLEQQGIPAQIYPAE
jgi:cell division septation protein DedD